MTVKTTDIHHDELGHQLVRMEMDKALSETFSGDECAICGSVQEVDDSMVISEKFTEQMNIPICRFGRDLMGENRIEDLLGAIQRRDPFLWSQIVIHNIRKTNWISRIVFEMLRERRHVEKMVDMTT